MFITSNNIQNIHFTFLHIKNTFLIFVCKFAKLSIDKTVSTVYTVNIQLEVMI